MRRHNKHKIQYEVSHQRQLWSFEIWMDKYRFVEG